MNVYLIRHGIAEEAAPGVDDASRRLTHAGARKMHLQAHALMRSGIRVDKIITSPLARAVETAEVLAEHLAVSIERDRLLSPGCRRTDLQELLVRMPDIHGVVVVGHQPDFGHLVYDLTGANIKMRKGAVAVVTLERADAPTGQLSGLYDPDVLASLGG